MRLAAISEMSKSRMAQWMPRCSNVDCTKSTFHLAPWRQRGFHVAEQWFCGSECLELGSREYITNLMIARGSGEISRSPRMPLGLLMFSREILSAGQLKQVLAEQRETGENVADIVRKFGFATEDQVTASIAAQWGCPTFNVEAQKPLLNVQVPRRLMESYRALPLHFVEKENKLLVGFVDAIHHQLLYTIESVTSFSVNACFIKPSAFEYALQSTPRTYRQNEILFDRKNSIAEMATVSRNYVLQSGAERARFGICQDYLWARVAGPKQSLDLLFRLPEN
jgi:hypothetical protein